MAQIKILSDSTINQISAGEVVSSPISCIKELIENSLDAKSTRIDVYIEKGGFELIEVKDNGAGIAKEQLEQTILRHATSKLATIADLEKISTMGFRGEALAAIASVSKLSIHSCLESEDIGRKLTTIGGKKPTIEPAAPIKGCRIQIKELFFNTPVRKKFQKSKTALNQEAALLLRSFALARCDVVFSLHTDGRKVFQAIKQSLCPLQEIFTLRSSHLFSEKFTDSSLWIEGKSKDRAIFGLISKPTLTTPNRSSQKVFLNNRLIQSKMIADAIEESYATSLSLDRHPSFSIHLQLKPDMFDVNVHPQKRFVRIKEEASLRDFIQSELQKTLFKKQNKEIPEQAVKMQALTAPTLSIDRFSIEEMNFDLQILASLRQYCLVDASTIPSLEKKGWILINIHHIWQKKNESKIKESSSQTLLFPLDLELDFEQRHYIESQSSQLKEFGFNLSIGPNGNYLLQTIPSFIDEKNALDFMIDIARSKKKLTYQELNRVAARTKFFSLEEKRALIIEAIKSVTLQSFEQKPNFCFIGKTQIETIFNQYAS